ncbi:hypothetical protein L873DRAFT_1473890 [Choiromyces venosus 120613-1]|uniref:Uncharacterized protein n=1 Tax=Choiromyces venosus 120613-1 TaxID=1336337 RepID=A0A3N4JAX1_9PEZI|nr:hypothetical protein L873DRAFT_1473890 [Choiromyces venosus 120613-1]
MGCCNRGVLERSYANSNWLLHNRVVRFGGLRYYRLWPYFYTQCPPGYNGIVDFFILLARGWGFCAQLRYLLWGSRVHGAQFPIGDKYNSLSRKNLCLIRGANRLKQSINDQNTPGIILCVRGILILTPVLINHLSKVSVIMGKQSAIVLIKPFVRISLVWASTGSYFLG